MYVCLIITIDRALSTLNTFCVFFISYFLSLHTRSNMNVIVNPYCTSGVHHDAPLHSAIVKIARLFPPVKIGANLPGKNTVK